MFSKQFLLISRVQFLHQIQPVKFVLHDDQCEIPPRVLQESDQAVQIEPIQILRVDHFRINSKFWLRQMRKRHIQACFHFIKHHSPQYRCQTNGFTTIVHQASIFSSRVDQKVIELSITPISANTKIELYKCLDSFPVQMTEQIKYKCIKFSSFQVHLRLKIATKRLNLFQCSRSNFYFKQKRSKTMFKNLKTFHIHKIHFSNFIDQIRTTSQVEKKLIHKRKRTKKKHVQSRKKSFIKFSLRGEETSLPSSRDSSFQILIKPVETILILFTKH